jgi:hypothetical protein
MTFFPPDMTLDILTMSKLISLSEIQRATTSSILVFIAIRGKHLREKYLETQEYKCIMRLRDLLDPEDLKPSPELFTELITNLRYLISKDNGNPYGALRECIDTFKECMDACIFYLGS